MVAMYHAGYRSVQMGISTNGMIYVTNKDPIGILLDNRYR